MQQPNDETKHDGIRVWDLPTRLFHWLLVAAFVTAWLTHEHDRYLYVHVFAGYVILGLLSFRLVWGMFGGPYARFRSFTFDWHAVRAHLAGVFSGHAPRYLGHNPAGAWFIFALLGLTTAVVITGLIALGGEERHGPLAGLFSFSTGAQFRGIHGGAAMVMLALIATHLAGVLIESFVSRENLVLAMISGHKRSHETAAKPTVSPRHGWTAFMVVVVAIGYGGWHFAGYALQTPERPYLPFEGPGLTDNATWRSECGSCHLPYHPSLLPSRSWAQMLDHQDQHFGEDLVLDADTLQTLRSYAARNAAETAPTEAAWKIKGSLTAQATPQRITETPYWKQKHRDITDTVWRREPIQSRANCGACHLDANRGTFEDSAMRMPPPTPVVPTVASTANRTTL